MKTADSRKLIGIIQDRIETGQCDTEGYFIAMEQCIADTFHKLRPELRPEYNPKGKTATTADRSGKDPDGPAQEAEFANLCWDFLEKDGGIQRIAGKEFLHDNALKRYLNICFENIFLDMNARTSPDFKARRKQMVRVLTPVCLSSYRDGTIWKNRWKLNSHASRETQPASAETLLAAAVDVPLPAVTYNRSETAQRGPRIEDRAMKQYITTILAKAGGDTDDDSLNALIHAQFNTRPFTTVSHPAENDTIEDSGPEDFLDALSLPHLDPMAGGEHLHTAELIFSSLSDHFISLFLHRFVHEKNITDTARHMGISPAGVSNMEKKMRDHLKHQFNISSAKLQPSEYLIILQLIKEMTLKNEKDRT